MRRDAPALVLLLFLYLNLCWSIMAAEWCQGLYILQPVVLGGGLIGYLLGRSRWRGGLAHLYALTAGTISLLLLVGTLLPQDLAWADRLGNLADRVAAFAEVLLTGGVNYDNLMFVGELMIVLGLVSYMSAWHLFRRGRVWPAVIFCGVGMLINLASTISPGLNVYLVLYMVGAMFLVMQVNLSARMAEWRRGRVRFGPDVTFDLIRYGVLLSLLLVGFAWVAPTAAASEPLLRLTRGLEGPWDAFLDRWNRLFAALNYQIYRPGDWFGPSMAFGGPVERNDWPIADVQGGGGRYYRGMVYDRYTAEGWVLAEFDEVAAGPEAAPFALPAFDGREVISQTVTVYQPGNRLLIGAAQPLPKVSIPARAQLFFMPRQGATAALPPPDLLALYAEYRLRAGDTYWIWSSVVDVDVQSLRKAGEEYPRWVTERYLQLPEDLPGRVRDLAEEVAAAHETAYDKVKALEAYLRALPYNDRIAAPPPGRDGVDYFLFDVRQGYCTYYASALAVMARAVGVPARMVAGYASEEYLPEEGVYRLRERDAHAWVEVFFPRFGWVEFEPTASEPAIVRRERPVVVGPTGPPPPEETPPPQEREEKFGPDAEPPPGEGLAGGATPAWVQWAQGRGRWVLLGVGLAGLLAVAGWLAWWRLQPRGLNAVEEAYERMLWYGRWLGAAPCWGQPTPLEWARALAGAVPAGAGQIEALAGLYVRHRYGGRPLGREAAEEAAARWARLRGTLYRALLWHWAEGLRARLGRFGRRKRPLEQRGMG